LVQSQLRGRAKNTTKDYHLHAKLLARIANPDWGDALGTDSPTGTCGDPALVSGFGCGMVWGYIIEGGQPPHFLLQRISETANPLAPNMIAQVE
jgi:hypothetical protein